MLRIHFTAADLVRTRVVTRVDPMWELVLSIHQVVSPEPYFGSWSRLARKRLAQAGLVRDAKLLVALAPIRGYFPDLLTPADQPTDFEAGVETVLSTGKQRLRAEVGQLSGGRGAGRWLDDVAAGRPAALNRLGVAMRRYNQAVVAPHTDQTSAVAGRWVSGLAHQALAHGVGAVLSSLGPATRWRAPVLEVDYPVTRELHLDGRGLSLVPTFFGVVHPITLADPQLQPVLVYPVSREPFWHPGPGADGEIQADALSELLGETRATVLRLIDTELSTTALAVRANTSPSSVSRHTAVLRRGGLITTRRRGTSVIHARTTLGTALVQGH
ncbi:helix-turn-helix protein [Promicromonospora sp. AC04]|uniref:ArsR/SmtB family transcription factor n=1 Tax=Promicromonospora sp. AC04 TaxID=2135723 RepID=UPI000D37804E|nr:helix-turn-helix domain-containing protein [Promicromonospora sp. AC04]PUB24990.1 helix-turn-helix protein [Promicromonospora sp. AC04]